MLRRRQGRNQSDGGLPVPGASASTTLISAAGLPGGRYFFEGFLPTRTRLRQERLQALAAGGQAFMLFEAPHRIEALAAELLQALEAEREVVVGRELTKRFEQIVRIPLKGSSSFTFTLLTLALFKIGRAHV